MDVDATRRQNHVVKPGACFQCGSTDHLIKDCPKRFDIREMTLEDAMAHFNQQALDQDAADIAEKEADVVEQPVEDFGTEGR
jgi:hypothetical protein